MSSSTRKQFFEYFAAHGHALVPSSPVIPQKDPTLLFVNAGMNQFKDFFLGKEKPSYKRAVTAQKCLRAGGKHNDLENVGHTDRHLTFFEMLGNFSFGDYFKEGAIDYAWEVATQIFGFAPKHLHATVFRDDQEAAKLWEKYLPSSQISKMGEADNFWAMGDTGPCGPCSELYLDRGASYHASASCPGDDPEGRRFVEFWNLVFMQYERDAQGVLVPLPSPSIDTGSGLERVLMLQQGKASLFETGALREVIGGLEALTGRHYRPGSTEAPSFHVVADHLRALAFCIADGAEPSNIERGYVLRKILRRAVRYGKQLGLERPFLGDLVGTLTQGMGGDYPELLVHGPRIAEICTREEEAFLKTLRRGGNLLSLVVQKAQAECHALLSGDDAFKLKDTYGLPLEEILLIAKDNGLNVDLARYEVLEKEAREKSRAAHKTTSQMTEGSPYPDYIAEHGPCMFLGYERLQSPACVKAIFVDGQPFDTLAEGQEGVVLLDRSPFYAEKGGQVGDTGALQGDAGTFLVTGTFSPYTGIIAHHGKISFGSLSVGDTVQACVDAKRRAQIAANHSATHLLHWALCDTLGAHIRQAGSVVDADRLRFDFHHHKALSQEEICLLEGKVNAKIRENATVHTEEIPYEQVQKRDDIKQFFGDKYGDTVRLVAMGQSQELCGGTHATATGDLGYFRIVKEGSISAGVRRIEAVTGACAEALAYEPQEALQTLADMLKSPVGQVHDRLSSLLKELDTLKEEIKREEKGRLAHLAKGLQSTSKTYGDVSVVMTVVDLDPKLLRDLGTAVSALLPKGILLLAATKEGKTQLLVQVSTPLTARFAASDLLSRITAITGGKGGGKADGAQASLMDTSRLQEAFDALEAYVKSVAC